VSLLQNPQFLMFMSEATKVLFVLAFGACIGSLVNVLVYRLPLGLDVVSPPSRCPSCETKLTWRENFPVFGWLRLLGKCRFCRSPISPEYPLVEAFVALLWAAVFLVLYADEGRFLGIHFGAIQPQWSGPINGGSGFVYTWPVFLVIVCLFSCLTAMTLVDAKTCFIPMQLTIVPVVVALVAHPLNALWVQCHLRNGALPKVACGEVWAMATPAGDHVWWWIGGCVGGVVGLLISNLMLAKGLIRRSFADYDAWEKQQVAAQKAESGSKPVGEEPSHPTDMWIQYPHARREMLKEIVFLAPCIGLGLVGAALAAKWAQPQHVFGLPPFVHMPPLWLIVLGAVLMGYLIGGAAVWGMRIFGTLAFGKEAIGLGDVHMMAAVGACLGWVNPVLAFFGAAFLGVAWWLVGLVFRGVARRAMPFGPYLAMGTVLVWFARPLVERLVSWLAHMPVCIP
jgi:leader peptidase (prepilin peptidase)/N-methyltransferase